MRDIISHRGRKYHFEVSDGDVFIEGTHYTPGECRDLAIEGGDLAQAFRIFLSNHGLDEDAIYGNI